MWDQIKSYVSEECEGGYATFINTLRHDFCDDPYCECECHDLDIVPALDGDEEDEDLPEINYDD